ncbi:MAG: DEAD/DEAH box helicase [bacterium]|nr:DEAD/DEAH box helicase [bacterium]
MAKNETPSFSRLGLAAPVLKAIDEVGYEAPTSIQANAIPALLARRDLLGQAQTGTGKTAAFALPLLSLLDLKLRQPQFLVLTPTRELAIQVAEAMQTYARHLKGFHVVPIYGGQGIETQLRQLRRGVHAVVGTPGRIRDHLGRKTLKLDRLSAVVLDEADEMLRMGFLEEVEEILQHTPGEKQVALFSATMPPAIMEVARRYQRDPVEFRSEEKTATVSTVSQRYWRVAGVNKLHALTLMLEVEDFDAMLVFVRTKVVTAELAEKLEARGFAAAPLNGDMNQAMRERTVERLKGGRLDIVVATDVAARGLHVERISHVVNFDMPYDVESYVHRIGRTARAGREGKAILFVSQRERNMLYAIERATGQSIEPMQLPSRGDIARRRVVQFQQAITEVIEEQDLDFFEEVLEGYRQEHSTGLPKIAAALAFLVQRERPLLPAQRARQDRAGRQPPTDRRPSTDRQPPGGQQPVRRRQATPRPRAEGQWPGPGNTVMERYRIEVGRDHGVQAGNILGAISNEADLEGRHVGRIKIFDAFSFVDLPKGMPREIRRHLKTLRICGQKIRLKLDSGLKSSSERRTGGSRPLGGGEPRYRKKPGKKKPGKKKSGAAGGKKKRKPRGKKPMR